MVILELVVAVVASWANKDTRKRFHTFYTLLKHSYGTLKKYDWSQIKNLSQVILPEMWNPGKTPVEIFIDKNNYL